MMAIVPAAMREPEDEDHTLGGPSEPSWELLLGDLWSMKENKSLILTPMLAWAVDRIKLPFIEMGEEWAYTGAS